MIDIQFSHRYGYGLMDAGAMAYLAKDWQNVPKMQRTCQKGIVKSPRSEHRSISQWVSPMRHWQCLLCNAVYCCF